MAIVRVCAKPDGSIYILRLNPHKPEVTFEAEIAKNLDLVGLPFIDIDESNLPQSRIMRDKWRVTGTKVITDNTIPNKAYPKQLLLDKAKTATTLDDIKVVLQSIILGKKE